MYFDLFKLVLFVYKMVQPLRGCDFILLISHGLSPMVIQIKPFQGIPKSLKDFNYE